MIILQCNLICQVIDGAVEEVVLCDGETGMMMRLEASAVDSTRIRAYQEIMQPRV